jgi:hypothetical protein
METSATISSSREATVDYLRGILIERVEVTSLRRVARELGMSPTGLKKFLLGTSPYSPTLRRLRHWYLHHSAGTATALLNEKDARICLDVLTYEITPTARERTVSAILDAVSVGYFRSGKPRPSWIEDLRAEQRGGLQ